MGFERRDAVGRGAGKANGDFVEVMAVRVNEFDAGDALQRVDDRVECSGVSNREGAHALGAEQRHVHRAHERDEGLVGAEVRGRAVTADVLLTGGQGQAVRGLLVFVDRAADDAAGHLTHVGLGAGEDAVDWTAGGHRRTEGLPFADHDVCTVMARRLVKAEGDRVDAHDEGGVLPTMSFTPTRLASSRPSGLGCST